MIKCISEKIDFLMKLTNTQNASLGRVLSFDASYISRIRNGKRGLPSEQAFIRPAAAYFASCITEEYQKHAIEKELHLNYPYPESEEAAQRLLLIWLKSNTAETNPLKGILPNMIDSIPPANIPDATYDTADGERAEALLFYGNKGKRDGVIAFLTALCETGGPHVLLLHSDEDMSWLYEDAKFVAAWTALLLRLVKNGCTIRIIHSINRDANEMWEAVRKWMPLYMTGAIEPYYYPRLRDGVCRRTLFVAEGHSAFFSNTTLRQQGNTLNLLIHSRDAVSALGNEFTAYMALCRPLMEVSYLDSITAFAPVIRSFTSAAGNPMASFSDQTVICIKDRFGALILKTAAPYVVFTLKEPHMLAAIEEYLQNLDGEVMTDKRKIHARLRALITEK